MRKIWWKAASHQDKNLLLSMMREYYSHDGLPFHAAKAERALENLLLNTQLGEIILICVSGEIVGYVVVTNGYSLEFGGAYQFIDELYIRERHRQRGLGKATLDFIEQLSRENGVTALHLEVEEDNKDAQKFYAQVGFKSHHRHLLVKMLPAISPQPELPSDPAPTL